MANKLLRHGGPWCKFCKDMGYEGWDTHYTKDMPGPSGCVICPELLRAICRDCGERGHMASHCKNAKSFKPRCDIGSPPKCEIGRPAKLVRSTAITLDNVSNESFSPIESDFPALTSVVWDNGIQSDKSAQPSKQEKLKKLNTTNIDWEGLRYEALVKDQEIRQLKEHMAKMSSEINYLNTHIISLSGMHDGLMQALQMVNGPMMSPYPGFNYYGDKEEGMYNGESTYPTPEECYDEFLDSEAEAYAGAEICNAMVDMDIDDMEYTESMMYDNFNEDNIFIGGGGQRCTPENEQVKKCNVWGDCSEDDEEGYVDIPNNGGQWINATNTVKLGMLSKSEPNLRNLCKNPWDILTD